jgi:dipeptidyl aminopeptidase/acylaminoacyl peptidase
VNFGAPEGYRLVAVARPGVLQSLFPKIENLEVQLRSISPIEQISEDDPPVLLIHGDVDKTVPLQQSEIFLEKYRASGKLVELIVRKGGGHTYWDGILDDYLAVWKWFDRDLGPSSKD